MLANKKISALGSLYIKENPVYLEEALESLDNQTLRADEVVMVIDGPITSELQAVLDSWSSRLPIKEVKLEKNVGLGRALNAGLAQCSHDLVARFDTDDINYPDRFKIQSERILKDGRIAAVSASIREFSITPGDLDVIRDGVQDSNSIVRFAKYRNPLNHASVMFRRHAVERVGGYLDLPLMEDYYLWLRLISAGEKFHCIDGVLVDVRVGNGMYARRKGISYISSEYRLFKVKNELSITNSIEGAIIFLIRVVPRLLPASFLQCIYFFLRKGS